MFILSHINTGSSCPGAALESCARQGSGSCMGSTTVQYLNQPHFRTLRAAESSASYRAPTSAVRESIDVIGPSDVNS
jgi:hypothetical protein